MYKFIRRLFSNEVVPAFALGLLGLVFFILWKASVGENQFSSPGGSRKKILEVLTFSWPYFAAAILSNQLSWHFSRANDTFPFFVFFLNSFAVALGFIFLFTGPIW